LDGERRQLSDIASSHCTSAAIVDLATARWVQLRAVMWPPLHYVP